jgi:uncharacterized RDD family membrane protein YckC
MKSASLLSRLSACFIDFIIWGILILLMVNQGTEWSNWYNSFTIILYSIVCLFIILLSWALFESSKLQGTPGKLLLHMKVVDEKGNRISYDLAFKRALLRIYSIFILGIGYVYLFGKEHRALHDVWSKTYVVEKN